MKEAARQARYTRAVISLTKRQINLARQEFTSTFPPKLDVRLIRTTEPDNGRVYLQWTIANVGGSSAKITRSNATIAFMQVPLPAAPPYSNEIDSMGDIVIPQGVSTGCDKRYALSLEQRGVPH